MRPNFLTWLQQKYPANTASSRHSNVARIEEHYGDLDRQFDDDQLESLLSSLRYSTQHQRRGLPNPSKIPIVGDIYNGLATLRGAAELYRSFRLNADRPGDEGLPTIVAKAVVDAADDRRQRFGLERDMQNALRRGIDQLEPGLTVIDNGAERSVESGFIDITARDASGVAVVIELKAGVAHEGAVGQILSYMSNVRDENEAEDVRGILVAADFDIKAASAAKFVPNLTLRRYSVKFEFIAV